MGGESFSRSYEEKLQKQVQEMYESFLKRNESKHILNAYRTPAVLLIIMALSYLFSSILDILGIESLSQTAIFGLYIPLLCMCVWGYVRYSGNFRELGQAIDNVTTVIWENVSVGGIGMDYLDGGVATYIVGPIYKWVRGHSYFLPPLYPCRCFNLSMPSCWRRACSRQSGWEPVEGQRLNQTRIVPDGVIILLYNYYDIVLFTHTMHYAVLIS